MNMLPRTKITFHLIIKNGHDANSRHARFFHSYSHLRSAASCPTASVPEFNDDILKLKIIMVSRSACSGLDSKSVALIRLEAGCRQFQVKL